MRNIGKILATSAAAGLLMAQPVAAATGSAGSLASASSVERTAAPVSKKNEELGAAFGLSPLILAGFAAVAAAIVWAIVEDDDDGLVDSPVSP